MLACVALTLVTVFAGQRAYYAIKPSRLAADLRIRVRPGQALCWGIGASVATFFISGGLVTLSLAQASSLRGLVVGAILACATFTTALLWRRYRSPALRLFGLPAARWLGVLAVFAISLTAGSFAEQTLQTLTGISPEEFSTARVALTAAYATLLWLLVLLPASLVALVITAVHWGYALIVDPPARAGCPQPWKALRRLRRRGSTLKDDDPVSNAFLLFGLAMSSLLLGYVPLYGLEHHDRIALRVVIATSFIDATAIDVGCPTGSAAKVRIVADGGKLLVFDGKRIRRVACDPSAPRGHH